MHSKLASIESNFFKSFMLDKNYEDILDMLKTIDMLSDTDTSTDLSGTNKTTGTNTRTDDLTSTKSARTDRTSGTSDTTATEGSRTDTIDTLNGGTTEKDTTYGKKETQGGTTKQTNNGTNTGKSRGVISNTPQSNIGEPIVGIDADLDWNYASGLQDSSSSQTNNSTQNTEHGLTDTLSGTDKELTKDNRTVMEIVDKGEQRNRSNTYVDNTFEEGEQSVTNTGTQDTQTTENREHQQLGKYKKINDNSGRTDNLAIIRQQWRDLLHTTITAYKYLFNELDDLFISIWDIDDDCFFTII